MPLNSTSATSLPPQKLMERCCRTLGQLSAALSDGAGRLLCVWQ